MHEKLRGGGGGQWQSYLSECLSSDWWGETVEGAAGFQG